MKGAACLTARRADTKRAHDRSRETVLPNQPRPIILLPIARLGMIDVKIEVSQSPGGWKQVACDVVQHDKQTPVLEVPAREDEVFPSQEIAIETLKGRVAFELQQNHIHESGDSVKWHIKIHPFEAQR
jgi:hypothetical protein